MAGIDWHEMRTRMRLACKPRELEVNWKDGKDALIDGRYQRRDAFCKVS